MERLNEFKEIDGKMMKRLLVKDIYLVYNEEHKIFEEVGKNGNWRSWI